MADLSTGTTSKIDESLEKKIYQIVEDLGEFLPGINDRNKLGFSLYKYVTGEGNHPLDIEQSSNLKIKGISKDELFDKINLALKKLKL